MDEVHLDEPDDDVGGVDKVDHDDGVDDDDDGVYEDDNGNAVPYFIVCLYFLVSSLMSHASFGQDLI